MHQNVELPPLPAEAQRRELVAHARAGAVPADRAHVRLRLLPDQTLDALERQATVEDPLLLHRRGLSDGPLSCPTRRRQGRGGGGGGGVVDATEGRLPEAEGERSGGRGRTTACRCAGTAAAIRAAAVVVVTAALALAFRGWRDGGGSGEREGGEVAVERRGDIVAVGDGGVLEQLVCSREGGHVCAVSAPPAKSLWENGVWDKRTLQVY